MSSPDIYTEITNQILAALERGVVPWRAPLRTSETNHWPCNHVSQRSYRGVNVFILAVLSVANGYSSNHWLTYRQAQELGGHVRKGEGSAPIVFWKQHTVEDRESGKDKIIPVLKRYRVFNLDQCDGIDRPPQENVEPLDFQPIEPAKDIVDRYLRGQGRGLRGPKVEHQGVQPCYLPSTDTVRMPEPEKFTSSEEYYATLFHELGHSTGHSERLNRYDVDDLPAFGSPDFAREELVVEMAAGFLCGHAGIAPAVIENTAAYIDNWSKVLKGDSRLVLQASGKATKASQWVLGERETDRPKPSLVAIAKQRSQNSR